MNEEDKKLEPNTTEPEVDTDPGDEAIDDVVFEDNTEVTGADYAVKVAKLKARIKELEKKNTELLDGWQRDKAEFVNSRRRDEEQKKEFLKFSKADTISEIIPVLDSFESAFKNKEVWEKVDKNWRTGVEYIHSQLFGILAGHGLKVINPIGEKYDHTRDEAVETLKVENESDADKILEVTQVGYSMNGKEIRPPKVKVSEYKV